MKKKLNIDIVKNELEGSVFFSDKKEDRPPSSLSENQPEIHPSQETIYDTMTPRKNGITTPSNHDTAIPPVKENMLETVRKAVKQVGKEAATHRFTLDEKQMLADIEYSYRRQGIRTSENEITRIAINYFVEDYKQNGENSLLAKALKRLNS